MAYTTVSGKNHACVKRTGNDFGVLDFNVPKTTCRKHGGGQEAHITFHSGPRMFKHVL